LKPFQKKQWVIPAEKSASFVFQMEQVLSVYERPYNELFPVVCMDESPKQVIDYKVFVGKDGKQYQDSEYIRKGVVELFVATEPLVGFRKLTVEDDHKSATWVQFIANLMDTVYKNATKVTWVMDNFSTHKLSFFYEHFTPEIAKSYIDRMEIVHTPAHGSWLNMAEIEFSVFTRQELDRPFSDKKQVQIVAAKWMKQQNLKEKKINWQFKNKNARIKLARLYPTI
jgi:DDE superfamily endonuclease